MSVIKHDNYGNDGGYVKIGYGRAQSIANREAMRQDSSSLMAGGAIFVSLPTSAGPLAQPRTTALPPTTAQGLTTSSQACLLSLL